MSGNTCTLRTSVEVNHPDMLRWCQRWQCFATTTENLQRGVFIQVASKLISHHGGHENMCNLFPVNVRLQSSHVIALGIVEDMQRNT